MNSEDKELLNEMFKVAGEIKKSIYGKRVVLFAPLYISDFCVNNCVYCGYKKCNTFKRRKLTQDEIREEVKILEKMGHKRLALELGEDPVNAPIEYVLESLDTIYKTQNENGNIRVLHSFSPISFNASCAAFCSASFLLFPLAVASRLLLR